MPHISNGTFFLHIFKYCVARIFGFSLFGQLMQKSDPSNSIIAYIKFLFNAFHSITTHD